MKGGSRVNKMRHAGCAEQRAVHTLQTLISCHVIQHQMFQNNNTKCSLTLTNAKIRGAHLFIQEEHDVSRAAASVRAAGGYQQKLPLYASNAASSSPSPHSCNDCESSPLLLPLSLLLLPLSLLLPDGSLYSLWPVDTANMGAEGCLRASMRGSAAAAGGWRTVPRR